MQIIINLMLYIKLQICISQLMTWLSFPPQSWTHWTKRVNSKRVCGNRLNTVKSTLDIYSRWVY